jgi:hypothetical protein
MTRCPKCRGTDIYLGLNHYSCNTCEPPKDLDGNVIKAKKPEVPKQYRQSVSLSDVHGKWIIWHDQFNPDEDGGA